MLTITSADPMGPEANLLIAELGADLMARYPQEDGTGGMTMDEFYAPRHEFLLACWEGEPASCCGIRPYPYAEQTHSETHIAEIKRMYTRTHHRGKGIAVQVMQELEAFARKEGYSVIRLETGVRQPEAIGLYKKMGFAVIPPYAHYVHDPESVCMEKQL
ncbi:GNAT family N-acetyltransferase [Deinococcus roseus]|uniref:N-acetyltransferase n=1 Tax=Deinococcus roseus TaxID=392414 RepID=A0ABQ2CV09_9DEIO|nr:GNAT family N-acetyltransferase [Deinococcus roseus]GGJ21982.1 N-acetyltransferase [Deinococcus roseus]